MLGRSAFRSGLFSTIVVAHLTNCGDKRVMFSVLVPTDFSECSRVAFAHARAALAQSPDPVQRVTLLCVLEDLVPASVQFEFGLTLFDSKSLLDEAEKHAKDRLAAYAKEFFPQVECSAVVLRGSKPTPTEIVNFARENTTSLIVLATHGRTGLQRWTLGSVTENVVRQASCPVLVIPAHDTPVRGSS